MFIEESDIAKISENPVRGLVTICARLRDNCKSVNKTGWSEDQLEMLSESYVLIAELIRAGKLTNPPQLEILVITKQNAAEVYAYILGAIYPYCEAANSATTLQSLSNKFRLALGFEFAYEFTQGDIDRLQTLLNEIRELIRTTPEFDEEHRRRLQQRFEKLQSELHKRVSNLDAFYGRVVDAGVALGKFGTAAKPIVDRMREVLQIVWQTQAHAEELPSGSKFPPELTHQPED